MFFLGLSPGSVDKRVTVFEKGESARRSRTTERSESVSEEAEERGSCIFSLRICAVFHTRHGALFIPSALMPKK